MQYLFLNGRHIRDRSLQHALGEAYRGLLMVGRFQCVSCTWKCLLNWWMSTCIPRSMEVRFQEGGKIYSQLLANFAASIPVDGPDRSSSQAPTFTARSWKLPVRSALRAVMERWMQPTRGHNRVMTRAGTLTRSA